MIECNQQAQVSIPATLTSRVYSAAAKQKTRTHQGTASFANRHTVCYLYQTMPTGGYTFLKENLCNRSTSQCRMYIFFIRKIGFSSCNESGTTDNPRSLCALLEISPAARF